MNIGFLLIFLLALSPLAAKEVDPFNDISLHQLSNGLKIILAPDPKSELVEVRILVGVGSSHESAENYGVSHLLEHVLFRSENLKDDMSYLQLITEKEGQANGMTEWDQTTYFATVKKNHGPWLIETFHTMLMNPTLSDKHVETEKKTVLLEIGEPNEVMKLLGFDVMRLYSPRYLAQKNYWEAEFNVNIGNHYSLTEEQLATLRLTPKQVIEHYRKYYDPSNMQILISGGFRKKEILSQITRLWGQHKSDGLGNRKPTYHPKLQNRPYYFHKIESGIPRIMVGYQAVDVGHKEKEILNSYFDYLAHRLMKKVRNISGETYTVRNSSSIRNGFGYMSLSFESSRQRYQDNLKLVREMMETEMVKENLREEDFQEAVRLYLNSFSLWGEGSLVKSQLAFKMYQDHEFYGTWLSPQKVLEGVTLKEYQAVLKKYANPRHRLTELDTPELFFHYDYVFLGIFSCLIFFFMFRTALLKPFFNDRVKWVRKVHYPPLKSAEIAVTGLAFYLFIHLNYVLERFVFQLHAVRSLGLVSEYLNVIASTSLIIGAFQTVISFFPSKLYVMNDKLVIKSLSYFSHHFPLKNIVSIDAVTPLELLKRPDVLFKLWKSFWYYDPKFWRKGILIELENKKYYFISCKVSDQAVAELKGLANIARPESGSSSDHESVPVPAAPAA